MTATRGVFFEPSEDEESEDPAVAMRAKVRREMIEKLAAEWNVFHHKMEVRSWRSEEERAEEGDYLACLCEEKVENQILELLEKKEVSFTEDQYHEFCSGFLRRQALPEDIRKNIRDLQQKLESEWWDKHKEKQDEDALRVSVIEELLSNLGARMMRPYEHWNEEEKTREWMERDRSNEY